MVWDFSEPPPAGSKWRVVTEGQLDRQARTARTLRQAARGDDGDGAGVSRPVLAVPAAFSSEDQVELEAFLDQRGRAIRHITERAVTVGDELRLAWAYRAALDGLPGAWALWVRLVRQAA